MNKLPTEDEIRKDAKDFIKRHKPIFDRLNEI